MVQQKACFQTAENYFRCLTPVTPNILSTTLCADITTLPAETNTAPYLSVSLVADARYLDFLPPHVCQRLLPSLILSVLPLPTGLLRQSYPMAASGVNVWLWKWNKGTE